MEPVEPCPDLHPLPIGWTRAVYAEDTPYRPLPVLICETRDRPVVSCWQLTWWERLYVLWTGQFYLTQLTFGDSLQPQLPEVARWPWRLREPEAPLPQPHLTP
jgi:hypothetical protein